MCINKIVCFLVSVAIYTSVCSQVTDVTALDSFAGKFITAIRTHEKQKVYLATDKTVFAAGESIWFKAFLLNAVSQKINTAGSFLFVDLVNEKDSVLKMVILDAANLQLNSRIVLPDSVTAGYYWLRAYTRQMAESDTGSVCVQPIYIAGITTGNNFTEPQINNDNTGSPPVINFYPEGGSIITGVNSTVALQVTDKNGKPLNIDGYIKDSRDTITTRFTTNKYGLAKFDFEPSGYRKYAAFINWQGKEISYPLPAFNFFAGQLAVTKQPGGYKLRVLLEDSVYSRDAVTYVTGICKDSLIFAGIGKGLYEVFVGGDKLPDGITTFYLFDKNFKILSERSVYTHDNNLHIKAATDKGIYGMRDKVTLSISVTDAGQHFVPSLMAVSVIDTLLEVAAAQCTAHNMYYGEHSIDNIFLARNECFTDDETELMMFLRNNTYQTLSKNINKQTVVDADSMLYIKGIAFTEKNNIPAADKVLTLLSNSGSPILYTETTNDKGRFSFAIKNYTDSTQFAIQVRNQNGRTENARIEIDSIAYPRFSTPVALKKYLPLQNTTVKKYINTYYGDELINWNPKEQLKPVKVKYIKKINYDITKRVSSYSSILTSDDLDENTSLGLALLRVAGLHLMGGLLVMDGPTSTNGFAEPLLIVNGAAVHISGSNTSVGNYSPTIEYLNGISPKDIDFIEILRGAEASNYGVRGGNGVILVNMLSKRRDINIAGENANLKKFYAKGISNPVSFPVTDYQRKDISTAAEDKRPTLFWNGSLLTGDAGNATLTFYTGDIPATYKIIITGITIHGDFIYKTITLKSK